MVTHPETVLPQCLLDPSVQFCLLTGAGGDHRVGVRGRVGGEAVELDLGKRKRLRECVEQGVGPMGHVGGAVRRVAVRAGDQQRGRGHGVEQLESEAGGEAVRAGVRDLDEQVGCLAQEHAAPAVRGVREDRERVSCVVGRP